MSVEDKEFHALVEKLAQQPPRTYGGQSTFVEDCAERFIELRDEARALLDPENLRDWYAFPS